MILRAACVFFAMVFSAETLPFSNMNLYPARTIQWNNNFHRFPSARYPVLQLPDRRSPGIFSGHLASSNHPLAPKFSGILNRIKQHSSSLNPSRSISPTRFSLNQYLDNMHQQTAQNVNWFEQRATDAVQQHKEHHNQRMTHLKEMLHHKFGPENTMDRLKQTFMRKETSMNKPPQYTWREKFIGIPYHTMNDDHKIVKKPGADLLGSLSPLNSGNPILVRVPAVITQRPVLPEVTTSVDVRQQSEATPTIPGYVFPITSKPYVPEVTHTTQITMPRLPSYTSEKAEITADENVEGSTTDRETTTKFVSNSYSTFLTNATLQMEATPLEPSTTQATALDDEVSRIPISSVTTSVIDVESTVNKTSPTFPFTTTITGNKFTSSITREKSTIVEILSTVPSTLSIDTTLGTERTPFQLPELETNGDAEMFTITDTAFTSPRTAPTSTSPSGFSTATPPWNPTDLEKTPLVYALSGFGYDSIPSSTDTTETSTESSSTLPSSILTETTENSKEISTTTVSAAVTETPAPELTTLLDVTTRHDYAPVVTYTDNVEIGTEVSSTFPEIIPTETTMMATEKLMTVDSLFSESTIYVEEATEIGSTLSSITLNEDTASWVEFLTTSSPLDISKIDEEKTTESVLIFASEIFTEPTTIMPERLTTSGYKTDDSAMDLEITVENGSEFFSTIPTDITTISYSAFDGTTIGADRTTDVLITLSPTVPIKKTKTSESTELLDELTIFRDDDPTSVVTETKSTIDAYATSSPTSLPEITTMITEGIAYSKIDTEQTTEIVSTLPSTILDETSNPGEEISTAADSLFNDYSTIDGETIAENVSTLSSNISTEPTTVGFDRLTNSDLTTDNSVIEDEITIENDSPLLSTIPTKTTSTAYSTIGVDTTIEVTTTLAPEVSSVSTPEITTVLDRLTISGDHNYMDLTNKAESTTEAEATFFYTIPIESTTIINVELTTSDPSSTDSTIEIERITEVVSTLPSTIPNETISSLVETTTAGSLLDDSTIDEGTVMENGTAVYSRIAIEAIATIPERLTTIESFISDSTHIPTEMTIYLEEISTTTSSTIDSSTTDKEPTIEVTPIFFYALPTETTETSELTTLLDESSQITDIYFTSLEHEVESTSKAYSVFPEIIPTKEATIISEGLATAVDQAFADSTFSTKETADVVPKSSSSTISNEIPTSWVEISTTDSPYDSLTSADPAFTKSTVNVQGTTEIVSTLLSTILDETTSSLVQMATTGSISDNSVIDEETTTEIEWRFYTTIPTKTATMVPEKLTTFDPNIYKSEIHTGPTVEHDSTLLSTISTEVPTTITPRLTTADLTYPTIDMEDVIEVITTIPSATSNETTTARSEISTTDSPFNSSIIDTETILESYSTLSPIITTDTIAIIPEKLTVFDLVIDNPEIATEVAMANGTYMLPTISTDTTGTVGSSLSSTTIDTEDTTEIFPTLSSTGSTESTKTPEITTLLNELSLYRDVEFTSVTNEAKSTTEADLIFSDTSTPEATTIISVGFTDVAQSFVDSTIITEETTEIVWTSAPTIANEIYTTDSYYGSSKINEEKMTESISTNSSENLTETNTILPEISTTIESYTSYSAEIETYLGKEKLPPSISAESYTTNFETMSPSDSWISEEETTTKYMPIFTTIVPIETTVRLEEMSTKPAFGSSIVDEETTKEIISTLPTTILNEINDLPTNTVYDLKATQNSPYREPNSENTYKRAGRLLQPNSHSLSPWFGRTAEEEPDERTLPNSISLMIEKLRENKVNPKEKRALSQFFGNMWPLLVERSRQERSEPINQKLVTFLNDFPRQRLSDVRKPAKVFSTENSNSAQSYVHVDADPFSNTIRNKYSIGGVETHPGKSSLLFGLPKNSAQSVRIVKFDDHTENHNSEYYQIDVNDDVDEFSTSRYNIDKVELEQKSNEQNFPYVEHDDFNYVHQFQT